MVAGGDERDPAAAVVDRALAILAENLQGWLDRRDSRSPDAPDRGPEVGHDL